MPSTIMSMQMQAHGFHGPAMAVGAMCASGNAAMLTAKMWLDAGVCSDVVVVATDLSGTPGNIRHFVDLGVLFVDRLRSRRAGPSRPTAWLPRRRSECGLRPLRQPEPAYLKVLGGAMTHDGFHAASINPDHAEIRRCFEFAVADARINPATCSI